MKWLAALAAAGLVLAAPAVGDPGQVSSGQADRSSGGGACQVRVGGPQAEVRASDIGVPMQRGDGSVSGSTGSSHGVYGPAELWGGPIDMQGAGTGPQC